MKGIPLCESSNLFDFTDSCMRASWGAIVPTAFVISLIVFPISIPGFPRAVITSARALFTTYLTLPEAEALTATDNDDGLPKVSSQAIPLWRTVIFSFVGLAQALAWLATGAYVLTTNALYAQSGIYHILTSLTWVYAAIRPVFWAKATAYADLFSLYLIHLTSGISLLGGAVYEHKVYGGPLPTLTLVALVLNLVAVLVLLSTVVTMPCQLPSERVKKEDIGLSVSPEDYTTIWGWITFSWVYPLIRRGTSMTMNEEDVWNLSPTMQSRPVFTKFSTISRPSLFRRLLAANSLDLILDMVLALLSTALDYAPPFFLKRIIDAIDNPASDSRAHAYIYALLTFVCTMLRAQAEVQHLWFARRAAGRVRSELMAAIYEKALKRADYSGVVDKDKHAKIADTKATDATDPTTDDPKAGADVGKIVNLMAVDADKIAFVVSLAYLFYVVPFGVLIAGAFLYNLLGISAFAGFFVIIAILPINKFVVKRNIRVYKGSSVSRDKRMGVLNELISAIKFVKFFAWEDRWIKRVMDARAVEIDWMVKARTNSVIYTALWSFAPMVVSLVSFSAFVYQGKELTVAIAFTSITLFAMIRLPLHSFPMLIDQFVQTRIALNRIATFLGEDEVTDQVSSIKQSPNHHNAEESEGLAIENGTFRWNEVPEESKPDNTKSKPATLGDDSDTVIDSGSTTGLSLSEDHKFELRDISVRFPEGELTVITGPTASGKSALLVALLGEMTIISGKLVMSKNTTKVGDHGLTQSISYAAQSPWLQHQSIKDNIVFGHTYNEERYNAVVECCALRPDLRMFEDGDQTEIGARGVSLSGGQKARVALARAVYAPAKYVLLDDPLSAVDSHTARFLYEKLFYGPLLANRTVILVTHHVDLVLPGAFYLIRMLDGRIDTQGTIKDLQAQGVLDHIKQDSAAEMKQEDPVAASEAPAEGQTLEDEAQQPTALNKKPRKLIEEERRETGAVEFAIYNTYLKASSYWTWGILALSIVLSQGLGVVEKLWIRTWGQAYGDDYRPDTYAFVSSAALTENGARVNEMLSSLVSHQHPSKLYLAQSPQFPNAYEHPLFYVAVYGAIGLTTALVSVTSTFVQYTGALRASRSMFKTLLEGVVRATMRWHDVTPQGRMLNRFGKDIETIDRELARSLSDVNYSLATFAAAILTVTVFFPLFLIPAAVLGYFYHKLAVGYLNTGRDLRRMESNSRSPIYSGFSELLDGIVTVRAFSAERRFMDGLHEKVDFTTKMWYNFWMTNRWLMLNFDTLGAFAVLITTLFALSGYVKAGTAGLCIVSAMSFTESVYWACRFWTTLELNLNSVERVVEYLDLPQEPPAIIQSNRPPAYWPSSSSDNSLIAAENLVVKYAPELPPVLHNVSFRLNAKERVGLLGRTGSGKSTLAMSILRFVDPASGRIMIDGVDIATIGVHDLRSRLTFIPQDATLFSGTLRDNLDPFGEHEDSECLDVLYRTHMIGESAYQSQLASRAPSPTPSVSLPTSSAASTITTNVNSKTAVSLDTQVSAGGTNFSQGQRQLIAMARALLRRSSIIILDEATSSIDFDTDAKIQATIREEFGESLLLTVAHRLRTVIDYDRLIVLDKGEIAEFDTPLNLIQKEDGIFRTMCVKSGSFLELEGAARAKSERDAAAAK
ncbi:P-loop containing nucleoside triphosphate hydrolase protein [Leucogyrophana mollusca]|uniref:P-loop containing nucleoside triphosphate hydrolase protein n=1 Tax=Leucogyrophana mollusca TaxID=85980 RepID=A0ACB8BNG2_9AGAM|nr:P-loop containing nucleoside triphosphate hydrolase protein [Leucogyrophana mollusca]